METLQTVLVTGASGAVGVNCVLQLLQKGYIVKATVRSLSKKDEVIKMLTTGGIISFEKLSFVEADLVSDDKWNEIMQGCHYVLHVASPTHNETKDENDMIRPAVDGVLRVLKAARDSGVKRVVMTSSFGALGFSNHDLNSETTEANWTDPNEKGLSAYEKSKALSERAAWDFINKEGGKLELTVINPVAIFGPLLGPVKSPSFGLIKNVLSGSMKAIPNIPLNAIDIRDVADLHIRAMVTPEAAGERFIASADGQISLPEIAKLLRDKMPGMAAKVSEKNIPNWLLRIAALFNAEAKRGVLFMKINRRVSNAKARKVLGWSPIADNEGAILATAEGMKKFGMV